VGQPQQTARQGVITNRILPSTDALLYVPPSAVIQRECFPKLLMETIPLQKTESSGDQCGLLLRAQVFARCQAVVSHRIGGAILIVPVRAKVGNLASIYRFDQIGSLIWQSLESPKGCAELIKVLERECAVDHEQAERAVTHFLNEMLSAELVEIYEEVQVPTPNSSVLEQ
jgi:hypothetical protein